MARVGSRRATWMMTMERETLHRLLRDMLLSRAFEERAAEEYGKGNIVGFLHLYPGEEAVAVGVINAAGPSDYIVSNYREHAHALVRGTPPREVMVAQRLLVELASDWRTLRKKLDRRRLTPEDYQGASFYLSNLGTFPIVESFDAVLPRPSGGGGRRRSSIFTAPR